MIRREMTLITRTQFIKNQVDAVQRLSAPALVAEIEATAGAQDTASCNGPATLQ
jgi:hypothetical protein